MNINVQTFEQPIGKFALSLMNAADIIKIMTTNAQKYDPLTFEESGNVQRELSNKRLKEIADYAKTPDACFPTAIILALPEAQNQEWSLNNDETILSINKMIPFALLVDGQHRMYGLKNAGEEYYSKFVIPVVFLYTPTLEQQAIIFSIINEKQTKVSFSLVSQLFGIISKRSPTKVAHSIASAFNTRKESPFYQRVKMLGKSSSLLSNETLTQGTIVRNIIPLFEKPKSKQSHNGVFYDLYMSKEESFALKVLLNYFNAIKNTWLMEWNDPKVYIITKTVGFIGFIKAFPFIYNEIDNSEEKTFYVEKFELYFQNVKHFMDTNENKYTLTSNTISSNSAGANKLMKIILDANNISY